MSKPILIFSFYLLWILLRLMDLSKDTNFDLFVKCNFRCKGWSIGQELLRKSRNHDLRRSLLLESFGQDSKEYSSSKNPKKKMNNLIYTHLSKLVKHSLVLCMDQHLLDNTWKFNLNIYQLFRKSYFYQDINVKITVISSNLIQTRNLVETNDLQCIERTSFYL